MVVGGGKKQGHVSLSDQHTQRCSVNLVSLPTPNNSTWSFLGGKGSYKSAWIEGCDGSVHWIGSWSGLEVWETKPVRTQHLVHWVLHGGRELEAINFRLPVYLQNPFQFSVSSYKRAILLPWPEIKTSSL